MVVRAFIAAGIPEELKTEIVRISSSLAGKIAGIKWTHRDNLHLTLKFLGDVEEAIVPDIQAILDQAVPEHLPIAYQLDGLGVFPNLRRPLILWLGLLRGGGKLSGLAVDLDKKLSGLGFIPEKRKFTPHLTLGRIKKGIPNGLLTKLLGPGEEKINLLSHSAGSLKINMLLFQKSTLTPRGAIHEIISEHRLKG